MSADDTVESAITAAAIAALHRRADAIRRRNAARITVVEVNGRSKPTIIIPSEIRPSMGAAALFDQIAYELGGRR
jgi:hypothetical protein